MGTVAPLAAALVGIALANVLVGISTAFLPRQSWLRWAMMLPGAGLLYSIGQEPAHSSPMRAGIVGGALIAVPLQYLEAVLLNRWEFTAQGPTSTLGGLKPAAEKVKRGVPDTFAHRLRFAGTMAFQSRYAATAWPVKGLPAFDSQRPRFVPTRGGFLWRMTYQLLILVLILDASAYAPRDPNHELIFSNARAPLFRRLGEVTSEEFGIRVISVFMYWFLGAVFLDALYHTVAIAHVSSGLASPAEYPPFFGRIQELYSVRQFWGTFWQQVLRRKLSTPAHYITYELLELRHGSLLSRYLFIFLTFFASGVLHTVSDSQAGLPFRESGALVFFCMQTLGIMVEDGVVATYRSLTGRHHRQPPLWAKVLGFCWLGAWMVWTGPSWMWNTLRLSESGSLPFSIIGLVLK